MRVVASLTTIPSRIENIEKTLNSIINQSYKLDAIYLNIPYTCQKEDSEYNIPSRLGDNCHIMRCQDYGPITKIVGALISEKDPDTIIITFDDDKIYPEELVKKMLYKHQHNSDCAIGSSGFKIGSFPFYMSKTFNSYHENGGWYCFEPLSTGTPVDVLIGSPGILYVRKFFPAIENIDKLLRHPVHDETLFDNSDIVLSGYLCKQNISRLVFLMPAVRDSGDIPIKSYKNIAEKMLSTIKAIYKVQQKGMFDIHVECKRSNTITFPFIMTITALILFSLMFSTRNKGQHVL